MADLAQLKECLCITAADARDRSAWQAGEKALAPYKGEEAIRLIAIELLLKLTVMTEQLRLLDPPVEEEDADNEDGPKRIRVHSRQETKKIGGCNFCYVRTKYVTSTTSPGGLEVRFCAACLKRLKEEG